MLRECKNLQTILGTLGMLDHPHENHIISLWQGFMITCVQKIKTSLLNSFLSYCKEIANLLFWVIWACLATHT